jgi:hypothetical protein
MVAIAESPITAPISTIITVLVPFVILHLGLPEKTKIYALLSPRHSLNPIYMCSLDPNTIDCSKRCLLGLIDTLKPFSSK